MIPSERQALELHGKYGSNWRVVNHCETVAKVSLVIAVRLAEKGLAPDTDAIAAAALLHDIGRNRTQAVDHGWVGADLLRAEGVDERVARIVQRHVGAGISKEEAATLGFPPGDYVPETLEERVVCFADKMVEGDKVRPFEGEVERFVRKGHDVERLQRLKRSLEEALGEDPEKLIFAKLKS